MEVLNQLPPVDSFVPLTEHQSTTPASFFSGPPVLHYYSDRSKVIVREDDLSSTPEIKTFVTKCETNVHPNETHANGTSQSENTLEDIDVWVTSAKLLLYSKPHEIGLSIPYPSICLHAIQNASRISDDEPTSQSLYMQILPSIDNNSMDDEPPDTISLTVIPTASAPPPPTVGADDAISSEDKPEQTPAQAMFTALSNCSNLHPDPVEDQDEDVDMEDSYGSRLIHSGLAVPGMSDGSLPPPMPGSGGWITAENMHEYFDEQGNWIGGEDEEEGVEDGDSQLGPGAGTIRTRDDNETNENGDGDTKWQRTS